MVNREWVVWGGRSCLVAGSSFSVIFNNQFSIFNGVSVQGIFVRRYLRIEN
jgi:hypothetical protein